MEKEKNRENDEQSLEDDVEDMILFSHIPLSFSDIKVRNPDMSDRRIYSQLHKAINRGFIEYEEVEIGNRKVKYYKEKKEMDE